MRIFIGAPTDAGEYAKSIFDYLTELKPYLEKISGNTVQINDWFRVSPAQGKPQEVIFRSTKFEDSDIFLFIFWHKIGSSGSQKSDWRVEMKKNKPELYSSENCISGTEEEIELALKITKDSSKRRIMIYKINQPIEPDSIDVAQLKELKNYLNDRLNNEVLLRYDVKSLNDLRLNVIKDVLQAVDSISSSVSIALKANQDLREWSYNVAHTENENQDRKSLYKYIGDECNSFSRVIIFTDGDFIKYSVRGTYLYEKIIDSMNNADSLKIIDLAINRWNELIDESRPNFNHVNYSKKILRITSERANLHSDFSLKRVFVLPPNVFVNETERSKLSRIFNAIIDFDGGYGSSNKIEMRVFFLDETFNKMDIKNYKILYSRASESIKRYRDFVICKVNNSKTILREDIEPDNQDKPSDTFGEISSERAYIDEAEAGFDNIWNLSRSLNEAISKLGQLGSSK